MKQKILVLFTSDFPNTTGGRETALYNLMKNISKDEIDWRIIAYENNLKQIFKLSKEAELFKVKTNFIRKKWLWTLSYPFSTVILFFRFLRKSIQIIKKEKIDYILVFGCGVIESCVLTLNKKYNIPFIISYRTNFKEEIKSNVIMRLFYKNFAIIEEKMIRQASIIFANGRDSKQHISQISPNKQIKLLYNGVSIAKYKKIKRIEFSFLNSSKKFTIISLASLRILKGINHLIQAISILDNDIQKKIRVIIVGKGSNVKLKELTKKLGLEDVIAFPGEIEHKLIPNILEYCDLSVFPGLNGVGLSHACLESLAAGVPIAAYDYADFSRVVIDGKTGLLIKKGDYNALSEAIRKIVTHEIKFTKNNCINMASKYDWSIISETFLSTIKANSLKR